MNFINHVEDSYLSLCKRLFNDLKDQEELSLSLYAEDSLFVRFNGAQVRQNTSVEQASLTLTLQDSTHGSQMQVSLLGHQDSDYARARTALTTLRGELQAMPADPFLVPMQNNGQSQSESLGQLLPADEVIPVIAQAAQGLDFAGLYCGGKQLVSNQNSKGQSHRFLTETFFVDYSLYQKEKAVKGSYAGKIWDSKKFQDKLKQSAEFLEMMKRPARKLQPGTYRAYLAPASVHEILQTLSWGGLSYSSYKEGGSGLRKLIDREVSISPLMGLRENFQHGLVPPFNDLGEMSPPEVSLIENGQIQNLLISTRSAKEFQVNSNQASSSESPRSLEMLPGSLEEKDILSSLHTGLYLSNLHYLNWSDLQNARMTGMTRYACFWVENGEIQGPIEDMRFDDNLYSLFGTDLEAITAHQDLEPSTGTYGSRSLGGVIVPGILVKSFHLTL